MASQAPPVPEQQEPEYVPVDDGQEPAVQQVAGEQAQEELDSWPPEQIAKAQQELKDMEPEDLLAIYDIIEVNDRLFSERALEEGYPYPEMGGIIFTKLVSAKGAEYNLTARGRTPMEATDLLAAGIRYAKAKYGLVPKTFGVPTQMQVSPPPVTATVAPPPPTTPAQPPTPAAPATPATASGEIPDGHIDKTGSGELKSIVRMEGRTEFHIDGLRWQIKDSRAPEIIAGLFDKDLGWTVEHFSVPVANYVRGNHWQRLVVDWVHRYNASRKKYYYNIERIHA